MIGSTAVPALSTMSAVDGEQDSMDCEVGEDRARVDRDVDNRVARNCEKVGVGRAVSYRATRNPNARQRKIRRPRGGTIRGP